MSYHVHLQAAKAFNPRDPEAEPFPNDPDAMDLVVSTDAKDAKGAEAIALAHAEQLESAEKAASRPYRTDFKVVSVTEDMP